MPSDAVARLGELLRQAGLQADLDPGNNHTYPCTFCGKPPDTVHKLRIIGSYPDGAPLSRPVCEGCSEIVDASDAVEAKRNEKLRVQVLDIARDDFYGHAVLHVMAQGPLEDFVKSCGPLVCSRIEWKLISTFGWGPPITSVRTTHSRAGRREAPTTLSCPTDARARLFEFRFRTLMRKIAPWNRGHPIRTLGPAFWRGLPENESMVWLKAYCPVRPSSTKLPRLLGRPSSPAAVWTPRS